MNWKKQYQYFDQISIDQIELFASKRETEKVLNTYNHALALLKSGKDNVAIPMLQTVADDYPMFSYAAHLYATTMAAQGDYKEANKYFKRVVLLDIDEIQTKLLQRQMKLTDLELNLLDQEEDRQKKRKDAYNSVKKEISITDVLEKSPRKKNVVGTSKEEIAEINRQLGNEDPVDLTTEFAREERRANIKFTVLVIAIALVAFLIFYFVFRPIFINSKSNSFQSQDRLEWLEEEMESRAGQGQSEVQKLLEDYKAIEDTGE